MLHSYSNFIHIKAEQDHYAAEVFLNTAISMMEIHAILSKSLLSPGLCLLISMYISAFNSQIKENFLQCANRILYFPIILISIESMLVSVTAFQYSLTHVS